MMWGSDYPHPEGTWPNTPGDVLNTFKGLPEDDVAAMLGGNAIEFYGFDREGIDAVGAEVGPLRADFAA